MYVWVCVEDIPSCDSCVKWTNWLDKDDPGAAGDWERFKAVRRVRQFVCLFGFSVALKHLDCIRFAKIRNDSGDPSDSRSDSTMKKTHSEYDLSRSRVYSSLFRE